MQLVFQTALILCILRLLFKASSAEILKPSFYPYCTTRDKCYPICSCETYPNCMVLSMDSTITDSILYYHNQIRDIQTKGEPQPAGMTKLEYDSELAEISRCWAARCDDEYSECFVTPKFSDTSQSVVQVVLAEGQEPNVFIWMEVMNEWLGQVSTVSAETIQSLPAGREAEKMNNYVQLMSDRILAVGCAWSRLDNVLTLVCTYGPRGPLQGESIYKTGYPCSLCPGGYACDYVKPYDQLCKLKIYSNVVQVNANQIGLETPPPPPPLPRLIEPKEFPYPQNSLQLPPPKPPPEPPAYGPQEPIIPVTVASPSGSSDITSQPFPTRSPVKKASPDRYERSGGIPHTPNLILLIISFMRFIVT